MIIAINKKVNENTQNIKNMKYLTHSLYPTQDTDYLGKVILMRYRNELGRIINNRFEIDPRVFTTYTGARRSGIPTYFRILRFDKVEPYTAILINANMEILVANSNDIKAQTYPNTYTGISNHNSLYKIGEAPYTTIDNTTFIATYDKEYIYNYPIQKEEYIGMPVYTEYYLDIFNTGISNTVTQDTPKTWNEITTEVITGNPALNIYTNTSELLHSSPYYHNNRDTNYVDSPRASVNTGYLLRADQGDNDQNKYVVMEYNSSTGYRFILSDEAYFYIENNSVVFTTTDPMDRLTSLTTDIIHSTSIVFNTGVTS